MKKQKRSFGINVGSSSILMIFVILCLVSFAVLSITSAQSDYKLSKKLADRSTSYYLACNDAEGRLAALADHLAEIYADTHSEADYFAKAGTQDSFSIELNEQQNLEVTITILYPETEDTFYRIDAWQVITNDDIPLDDTLKLPTEEDSSFQLPF